MGMFLLNTFLICLAIIIIFITFFVILAVFAAIWQWLEEETDIIDWLKEKWHNRKGGKTE